MCLMIGKTKAGKSALIAYLLEKGMTISLSQNDFAIETENGSPKIGNDANSCTLLAAKYEDYIDLPGLENTGGPLVELKDKFELYDSLVTYRHLEFRFIIVASVNDILQGKSSDFLRTTNEICNLFQFDPENYRVIHVVLTQCKVIEINLVKSVLKNKVTGQRNCIIQGIIDDHITCSFWHEPEGDPEGDSGKFSFNKNDRDKIKEGIGALENGSSNGLNLLEKSIMKEIESIIFDQTVATNTPDTYQITGEFIKTSILSKEINAKTVSIMATKLLFIDSDLKFLSEKLTIESPYIMVRSGIDVKFIITGQSAVIEFCGSIRRFINSQNLWIIRHKQRIGDQLSFPDEPKNDFLPTVGLVRVESIIVNSWIKENLSWNNQLLELFLKFNITHDLPINNRFEVKQSTIELTGKLYVNECFMNSKKESKKRYPSLKDFESTTEFLRTQAINNDPKATFIFENIIGGVPSIFELIMSNKFEKFGSQNGVLNAIKLLLLKRYLELIMYLRQQNTGLENTQEVISILNGNGYEGDIDSLAEKFKERMNSPLSENEYRSFCRVFSHLYQSQEGREKLEKFFLLVDNRRYYAMIETGIVIGIGIGVGVGIVSSYSSNSYARFGGGAAGAVLAVVVVAGIHGISAIVYTGYVGEAIEL